jgi:hypothetical protein
LIAWFTLNDLSFSCKVSFDRLLIPVKYNPVNPARFEIEGVVGGSLAGAIFIFCFFFVGFVFAAINLIKRSKSHPMNS